MLLPGPDQASLIVHDLFRQAATQVLRVCQAACQPDSAQGVVNIEFTSALNHEAFNFPGTDLNALARYTTMEPQTRLMGILTLVFLILNDRDAKSSQEATKQQEALITCLHNVLCPPVDTDNSQVRGRPPPKSDVAILLLQACLFWVDRLPYLQPHSAEILLSQLLPISIQVGLRLCAEDECDAVTVLALETERRSPLAEPPGGSEAVRTLMFALVLQALRNILPGCPDRSSVLLADCIRTLCFRHGELLDLIGQSPTVSVAFVLHIMRWVSVQGSNAQAANTGDVQDPSLQLLHLLWDHEVLRSNLLKAGGRVLGAASFELGSAFRVEWPITDKIIEVDPRIYKMLVPASPCRYLDTFLLSPKMRGRLDAGDEQTAETDQEGTRIPYGIDKNVLGAVSLPLRNFQVSTGAAWSTLNGYHPKQFDHFLTHRLSQKLDIVCPLCVSYLNVQYSHLCSEATEPSETGDHRRPTVMASITDNRPPLLAFLSASVLSPRERFFNMTIWLVSICGAGYRFPLSSIGKLPLTPEVRARLPSSFLFTVRLSSKSVTLSRLALLSPMLYFSPRGRKYRRPDPLPFRPDSLPEARYIQVFLAALAAAGQRSIRVLPDTARDPLDPDWSSLIELMKNMGFAMLPGDLICLCFDDPDLETRFLDGFWLLDMLLTHAASEGLLDSTCLAVLGVSCWQLFRYIFTAGRVNTMDLGAPDTDELEAYFRAVALIIRDLSVEQIIKTHTLLGRLFVILSPNPATKIYQTVRSSFNKLQRLVKEFCSLPCLKGPDSSTPPESTEGSGSVFEWFAKTVPELRQRFDKKQIQLPTPETVSGAKAPTATVQPEPQLLLPMIRRDVMEGLRNRLSILRPHEECEYQEARIRSELSVHMQALKKVILANLRRNRSPLDVIDTSVSGNPRKATDGMAIETSLVDRLAGTLFESCFSTEEDLKTCVELFAATFDSFCEAVGPFYEVNIRPGIAASELGAALIFHFVDEYCHHRDSAETDYGHIENIMLATLLTNGLEAVDDIIFSEKWLRQGNVQALEVGLKRLLILNLYLHQQPNVYAALNQLSRKLLSQHHAQHCFPFYCVLDDGGEAQLSKLMESGTSLEQAAAAALLAGHQIALQAFDRTACSHRFAAKVHNFVSGLAKDPWWARYATGLGIQEYCTGLEAQQAAWLDVFGRDILDLDLNG